MRSQILDIKKIFAAALIAVAFVVVAVPPTTFAHSSSQTQVTGNVTENGNPIKNATVTVVCNGKSKTDKTNKAGTYRVEYKAKVCPKDSTVTVTATTKDGKSGTSTGVAGKVTTKLNVAVVNVSVPEIGSVAAIAAMAAGGGAIVYARRRQFQG